MLVGFAVTLAPVVADKLAAGDQVNVIAVPVAVSVVDAPLQMATPVPALTVGSAFTVTVTLAVLLHIPLLPVTR